MAKKWKPVEITTEPTTLVAEDWWEYRRHGKKVISRVAVAQPQPHPSGRDWYCPLLFEHVMPGWKAIYGVGPIDSLMNALMFVNRFFHEFSPGPRGGSPPLKKRGKAKSKRSRRRGKSIR